MFVLYIQRTISCAHQLNLPYKSKCNTLHGHNYKIELWIKSKKLNKEKMIIDFNKIKEIIDFYDHKNLNDFIKPTTTENFAYILAKKFKKFGKVRIRVWESNKTYIEVKL